MINRRGPFQGVEVGRASYKHSDHIHQERLAAFLSDHHHNLRRIRRRFVTLVISFLLWIQSLLTSASLPAFYRLYKTIPASQDVESFERIDGAMMKLFHYTLGEFEVPVASMNISILGINSWMPNHVQVFH